MAAVLIGCGEAPTNPPAKDTAGAPAAETSAPPPPLPANTPAGPYAFTCAEFSKMTEAMLIQKFGAANVVTEEIQGPTGAYAATVVLPKNPTHRLEVTWIDSAAKNKVETAAVGGAATSEWVGAQGLAIGMSLLDVEAKNTKPFAMKNLDAYGWNGGAIVEGPKCTTHAMFKTNKDGPGEFWSTDEGLRALQPIVSRIKLSFEP